MDRVTILMPSGLHDEILRQAEREYTSKSDLIRRAVVEYLNKKGAIDSGEDGPRVYIERVTTHEDRRKQG